MSLFRLPICSGLALLALALSAHGASGDLKAGQDRVQSFLGELQGLQAQFHQVLTDRSGRAIDEASGVLAI